LSDGNNIFRDGGAVLGGVNSTSRFLRKIVSRLRNLNLVQQFALAGSIVVIIAMTVIGRWVAMQIEGGVVNSTSAATALYMDAILAPIVPDLINEGGQRTIPDERINHIMRQTEFGQRVVSIKIWKRDGHIIFSNRKELIGRQFVPSLHLKKAWSGVVSAEFDNLSDEEDTHERASGLPLLEMYMPVRQKSDGKIIAVAEFYILAHQLRADLARAYGRSWVLSKAMSRYAKLN